MKSFTNMSVALAAAVFRMPAPMIARQPTSIVPAV